MSGWARTAVAACVCGAVFSAAAPACSIPVFRYALEHWVPAPYEAVVYHSGPLTAGDRARVEEFKKWLEDAPSCNLQLVTVDLKEPHDEARAALWKSQTKAELPWIVLRYPSRFEEPEVIWAGRLNAGNVKSLVDSPKRREIARRFGAGDSVVWILLESGDRKKDDAAANVLSATLRKAEKAIREQRGAETADAPDAGPDAGPPVKFAFSMLRLARDDAAEELVVTTLLRSDPELSKVREPVAFPVIGRGRFFEPLSGKMLTDENIQSALEFFAGPCSCEVKEASIGRDLLMTADWEKIAAGELQSKEATEKAPEPAPPPVSAEVRQSAATPLPIAPPPVSEQFALLPLFGILLALAAVVLLVVLWKKKALGVFGFAAGGSLAVCALLVAALHWHPGEQATAANKTFLVVYCAAGIKPPVEAAVKSYEREYGVAVHLQYGPSEGLLANIKVARRGDLYLPADESYLNSARELGLADESIPLALMRPVIAVQKGNPKKIQTTRDLQRDDVRVALASPAAAVGKLARELLQQSGEWETLKTKLEQTGAKTVEVGMVTEVANSLKVGAVDAGIIWDATVRQYPELEMVRVELFDKAVSKVAIGVLRCSQQPAAALHFARYLAASDRGLPEFKRYGYEPVAGEAWVDRPELTLFAGAMLRPALEQTLAEFEQREGVRINRVYNGCGILVAEMKAGKKPDAYFACDLSFMESMQEVFDAPLTVSSNDIVILVKKGNPLNIRDARDLVRAGVKIGVGEERQSALGALTQMRLRDAGLRDEIMKNAKVQSPTGDYLVNQLRTGSLDAVIAYASNAGGLPDIETVSLNIPQAFAAQPLAISKETKYKQLAERLRQSLLSARSKERFKAAGFHWKAETK